MHRLANHPKFQAFDSNGDPLSGGKLYTYDAGTTDNKTTYSDRALSAPNDNPIILDSRGECACYFSGTMKMLLKTSADVEVWSMDNLKATEDSLVGDATPGRVLRCIKLTIEDATSADEIKCTAISLWNGDAFATTDNLGKGETISNFSLNASGNTLTLEAAGLTGNCIAVLSGDLVKNFTNSDLICQVALLNNDIVVQFYAQQADSQSDMTGLVDDEAGGEILVNITYLTDE